MAWRPPDLWDTMHGLGFRLCRLSSSVAHAMSFCCIAGQAHIRDHLRMDDVFQYWEALLRGYAHKCSWAPQLAAGLIEIPVCQCCKVNSRKSQWKCGRGSGVWRLQNQKRIEVLSPFVCVCAGKGGAPYSHTQKGALKHDLAKGQSEMRVRTCAVCSKRARPLGLYRVAARRPVVCRVLLAHMRA